MVVNLFELFIDFIIIFFLSWNEMDGELELRLSRPLMLCYLSVGVHVSHVGVCIHPGDRFDYLLLPHFLHYPFTF